MKQTIQLLVIFLLTGFLATAQNNIGIGTNTPAPSAALDINSSSKGLLIPRMTTAQRNAVVSPATGLMVFDNENNSFWYFNGSNWTSLAGSNLLSLPYSATVNTAIPSLKVVNNGPEAAVEGNSTNSLGVGLSGKTTGELGWGVYAVSNRRDARSINAIADSGTVFRGEITYSNNTNNLMSLQNAGKGKALLVQQSNPTGDGAAMQIGQNGYGEGLIMYQTSIANTKPGLTIQSSGIGSGIKIDLSNNNTLARAIDINNAGYGPGVFAVSNGNALWGITSGSGSAAVFGQHTNRGEAVVGISNGGTGYGAVVGRNDSSGYGVRGFNTDNGIGVLGQSGINGGMGVGGRFENVNATNSSDALQAATNGAGWAANFSNSNNSASAKGLKVATTNGQGGNAFNISNGTFATSSQRPYVSNTVVDDPVLIITTTGTVTIPTGAPLVNGTHIWVMNNSGGTVSISNTTAGALGIANGRLQHFVFISAVSNSNWIPAQ